MSFLKNFEFIPKIIFTDRLVLFPFNAKICNEILNSNFKTIESLGLKKGLNWPDVDILETLPKIILNLSKVQSPTGFESWMIVKKETNEIIGDIGFKGFNASTNSCDIGYGIIEAERRKGYAEEATKAITNWILKNDYSISITAATLLNNSASIQLLQKLNFIEINRNEVFIFWKLMR